MDKRITTAVLAILCAIAVSFTAFGLEINTLDGVKSAVEGVISYKSTALKAASLTELLDELSKNAGDFSADWYYIALSRYGVDCANKNSVNALKKKVDEFYSEGLENVKVTDLQRTAFALLSCKEDITDINGHNLLADSTYNRSKYASLDSQGVNSLSYALMLLDSKKYNIPESASIDRDSIISSILSLELENGGFSLFGNGADIDITAIVLQSLAPYKKRADVGECINRSLGILSKRQDESGAYKSYTSKPTSETTAQVIIALTALNINPVTDSRFIKNGNTLLDGLQGFQLKNGAFCHMMGYAANNIATYQSLCGLVAVYRFLNGDKPFYDFTDKVISTTASINKAIKKTVAKAKKTVSKNKTKSSLKSSAYVSNNNSNKKNKIKNSASSSIYKSNKASKKPKKITADSISEETSPTEAATVYSNMSKKSPSADIKKQPSYINSVILLSAYIIIFALKLRGKK